MTKKVLLFAPAAYNFAETSRMTEIAKAIRNHPKANEVFDIQFISEGGKFEELIRKNNFNYITVDPSLTDEKIEHIYAVNDEEKFAPIYTKKEMIQKVNTDIKYLKQIKPVAVITGSYLSMPVSCKVLDIPLVWAVQSTWFKDFFSKGAGITDELKSKLIKEIADFFIFSFIKFWMWYGFIHPVNQAAKYFKLKSYKPIFSFFEGKVTLVAEPPEFSGAKLPEDYYFIGPLFAREDFPIPDEVKNIPFDKPIVFFAMGSSGIPEIVSKIIESFEGKPYRVIAPVKSLIAKNPNIKIPSNVYVTDWLPALEINKMADIAVIHGGVGTVMNAAYSGRPVVGIGMQPEQRANISCLVREGFAIRLPKSKDVGEKVQVAIEQLLADEDAKKKAIDFANKIEKWNDPSIVAELLYNKFS